MSITDQLEREIEWELKMLDYYRGISRYNEGSTLYSRWPQNGKVQFYYRSKKEKKTIYIKRSDYDKLKNIALGKISEKAAAVLESNISNLQNVMNTFEPYDLSSLIDGLAPAYKDAINVLSSSYDVLPKDIPEQKAPELTLESDNSYREDTRRYLVSNGMLVRSKSEAIIAEYLLTAGIPFEYEKALELTSIYTDEAGFRHKIMRRVYPDFTIYLPNGSVILWEHEGLMEDENYRKKNIEKLMLYFQNGYTIPNNLIITMERSDIPLDTGALQRIIEGFLQPLFK